VIFCFTVFFHSVSLLFFGISLDGYSISIREIFELFRYFIIFIIFIAAYNEPSIQKVEFWSKTFSNSLIVYLIIVMVSIFEIPLLSNIVDLLFGSSKGRYISLVDLRQSGFFANPNWASIYLVWLFIFFKENTLKRKHLNTALLVVTASLIIATGSRTGVVCLLSVIVLKSMFNLTFKKKIIYVTVLYLFSFVFSLYEQKLLLLIPIRIRDLIHLIKTGSVFEIDSLTIRMDTWKYAIENIFYMNPFIGAGPFKIQFGAVFDSQFIKWLIWYGVLGLFYTLAFFLFVTFYINSRKVFHYSSVKLFGNSLFYISISLIISGITGAFFDNTQLIFLFFILVASFLGMVKTKSTNEKIQPF
jgi:hypothetical protein